MVSIFLNPAQFGENEDFDRYPRRLESDVSLLGRAGVDGVFAPDASEMYPSGFCTWVVQEGLTERLCGASRPDFFRGVCTVVAKLFAIIPADRAYFGRKDLQQSVVIKRMVTDLDIPVDIRVMPIVRESDGLALSSRNRYLIGGQRREATCLHEALMEVRDRFRGGERDVDCLTEALCGRLSRPATAEPEYGEIVAPDTLARPRSASPDAVAVVAALIGGTRLIDNMPLGGELEDIYLPPE